MVSSASTSSFNGEESPTFERHNDGPDDLIECKVEKPMTNGKFKNPQNDTIIEEGFEMTPLNESNSQKPTGIETTL